MDMENIFERWAKDRLYADRILSSKAHGLGKIECYGMDGMEFAEVSIFADTYTYTRRVNSGYFTDILNDTGVDLEQFNSTRMSVNEFEREKVERFMKEKRGSLGKK